MPQSQCPLSPQKKKKKKKKEKKKKKKLTKTNVEGTQALLSTLPAT